MKLNWISYSLDKFDGYGRYGRHMIRALTRLGIEVTPILLCQTQLPGWIQALQQVDYSGLTISCIPPYMLTTIPGRQWILTMTEGTKTPPGWAERINTVCERVIVPCEHNKQAFKSSGTTKPIYVVPGGTSPQEFPFLQNSRRNGSYTFLALGDRGARKGWVEVWQAFFQAFRNTKDVRLIIKTRPHTNNLLETISGAVVRDPRIKFWLSDVDDMADLYAQVDCAAFPSRSEGWGMPPREAAMMGLPVIATRYSGLEEGIDEWAAVILENLHPETIPKGYAEHIQGEWVRADINELTNAMRWCYEYRDQVKQKAARGAKWLRENQTWVHSAQKLIELVEAYC